MAIAPPARRLWEPTSFGNSPWRSSFCTVTDCRIAAVMSLAWSSLGLLELCGKYALMHVWGPRVLLRIVVSCLMMVVIGQVSVPVAVASWCTLWFFYGHFFG